MTFSTIDGKPIRCSLGGVIHACEGSDMHPRIRLLWTKCNKDLPADGAWLAEPSDVVTCPDCLKPDTPL